MKIEIKLNPEIAEPYAVIYAKEMTEELGKLAAMLQGREAAGVVSATENGRITVLRPEQIYMARVENEKTVLYVKEGQLGCAKRLYELESVLGGEFMRISKSALVNLRQLESVEPSFGAMMLLILKNGCREYVSRKYLPEFKKYLGL